MWEKGLNIFDEAPQQETFDQVTNTSLDEKGRVLSLDLGFDFDTLDEDERRGSMFFTELIKSELEARDSKSKGNLPPLNDNSLAPCSDYDNLPIEKSGRVNIELSNYNTKELGDRNPKPKKSLESLHAEERVNSLASGFDFDDALEASQRSHGSNVKPIKSKLQSRKSKPKKSRRVPKQVDLPSKNTSGAAKSMPPSGQYYQILLNNLITSMERSEKTRKEVQKMKKELKTHKNSGYLNKSKATKKSQSTQFAKHRMCL